jgi:hypothetical protein
MRRITLAFTNARSARVCGTKAQGLPLAKLKEALMNENLTTSQRAIYMLAGLGLAASSVKPRPNPLLNVLALASGAYLAWRGYEGSCPVKAALFENDGDHQSLPAE